MRPLPFDVSDTVRRHIGRIYAATSVLLSVAGLSTLAALGGWDTLVATNVLYLAVLGFGFGILTWIMIPAQPDNGAVWALAWAGLFAALFTAGLAAALLLGRQAFPGLTYDELRELSPSVLPLSSALPLSVWFWAIVPAFWLPLTFGVLLFPNGRPPSPQWRWVGWFSFVAIGMATIATAYAQNPWSSLPVKSSEDSIDSVAGTLIDLGFLLASVGAILSVVSLAVRYRRSDGTTRGQIRWIGSGGVVYIFTLMAGDWLESELGDGLVSNLMGVVVLSMLIGCWGVAITKYRLYDIDVVISKSVTYLGLGAVITVLFAVVVAGPSLLIGRSDDGEPDLVLAVAATGLVAVLFEPIRSRMHRWANRLVYGQRSSPHEVLSQVTTRLSETGRSGNSDDLARLLADGTGAVQAVLWLQHDEVLEPLGSWSADGARSIPPVRRGVLVEDDLTVVRQVRHGHEVLGAVSITKARNDPATPADRELVSDVAAGAALMLRNIGLNRQLEGRARQVRESRQRLIAAQDAERHRLERDLHDGAQQQVVALKVKLGIAKTIAEREGADQVALLVSGLAEETQQAVDALRAVAHGIYPPLLEAEGLDVALRAAERTSSAPLAIETVGVGRYPRHVEETVYFCALDAAERAHMAGATGVRVVVSDSAGELIVEIDHDGRLAAADLTTISDRVDAYGGTTTVESLPGGSTRISGRIPAGESTRESA